MAPRTSYARNGGFSIAYQVVGDGPVDIVHAPPGVSHLEYGWEGPEHARYLRRLASFSRLILFDKRGCGLSDHAAGIASMEERMDDMRAVMDAAGSARAVVYGVSESAPLGCLFAATYPERTVALVLCNAYAADVRAPDYPWPPTAEEYAAYLDALADTIHETWGATFADDFIASRAPSAIGDTAFHTWLATLLRLGASPGAWLDLLRMDAKIDVRHVLPSIRVPTLVLHRVDVQGTVVAQARYVAAHIPDARLVELPGRDYFQFLGDMDAFVDEIEAFVTGTRPHAVPGYLLVTVLAIELVGTAERAIALGNRRWADVQDRFRELASRQIDHFRGGWRDLSGDRVVATFDGPARAIRCAQAIGHAARDLGLATRSGLHTGECELRGDQVSGVTVPLASWVAGQAAPDEILVSHTVKDLVVGADLRFADRGARSLSGAPGEWRLFAVRFGAADGRDVSGAGRTALQKRGRRRCHQERA